MAEYLTHTTKHNDRWDLIALEYYGDPLFIQPLLRANTEHASKCLLEAGLKLKIPLFEQAKIAPVKPEIVEWR